MVKRIEVKPSWSGDDLVNVLERGRTKVLPYTDDFKEDRGWIKTWDSRAVTDNALVLSSHATATGTSIFLDGTVHWRNYRFEAVIDWQQGQSLSLLTRFKDSENFVACTFSHRDIRIEEQVHGEQRIVRRLRQMLTRFRNPHDHHTFRQETSRSWAGEIYDGKPVYERAIGNS